jgi:hypothetical protein
MMVSLNLQLLIMYCWLCSMFFRYICSSIGWEWTAQRWSSSTLHPFQWPLLRKRSRQSTQRTSITSSTFCQWNPLKFSPSHLGPRISRHASPSSQHIAPGTQTNDSPAQNGHYIA